MVWEPEKECMQRDELRQLQLEQLQAVLARVYMHVPFYRKQFDACKVDPDDFRSLDDVRQLPFTSKADLQENYPYGLFAVPLREVVRIHASACMSTVVGYTRNDIKTWSNLVARVLGAGGVGKDDVVQIAYGYDLSTGGFGIHYGAERIGASVIPTSTGNTARQIKIMRDFKTTALVCTPSYALLIAETIHKQGINPGVLSLKYGLFGGEPWSEAVRQEIQDKLHIVATDNYGVSEVMGPGVASECTERNGLHINEDHFLVEVVDPKTLNPLPVGETGELVITTLTKEAFPVIRFRTRDLTSLLAEPCPCGRKTMRMARVAGRSDDVLIIRGTKVSPSQIATLLGEIEGQVPPHQVVVERPGALDEVTVLIAPGESGAFDELRKQHERLAAIERRLSSELGLSINVKLVERKSVESGPRVLDKRKA
ncbi:MAG: phenylacetate--CoA ligase [Polyangia bacterium]|jgi:phenylacetate-CoA ligase